MFDVSKRALSFALIVPVLFVFFWVVMNTAWLGDDMLISLRQVFNASNGDGFVFNYEQRVQAFTHPAWVVLLTLFSTITRELFYTNLIISISFSMVSIVILYCYALKKSMNQYTFIVSALFIVALSFSRAFTDYMTSGLENPLSFLVVGLSVYLLVRQDELSSKSIVVLFVLLAVAFLNRFDYAVLLFPLVIYLLFFKVGFKRSLILSIPGVVLILSWFIFSIIYFGAPFPNTFYAKLGAQYPSHEMYSRGIEYYKMTFKYDPITLLFIFSGIVIGLFNKNGVNRALSLGLILYSLYIIKSGGDFMMGRFFAVPVYLSIFIIISFIQTDSKKVHLILMGAVIAVAIINFQRAPILSGADYDNKVIENGVADERGFYYQRWGLLAPNKKWPVPVVMPENKPETYWDKCTLIGLYGLTRPNLYLTDICALTDPLMSRLPAIQRAGWRIGHHVRKLPTNYGEYLLDGTKLEDKELQVMLDDIELMVSGEIFTWERFKAIYRVNISKPYSIDLSQYSDSAKHIPKSTKLDVVSYDVLNHQKVMNGTLWNAPSHKVFSNGLEVNFDSPASARLISLSLDNNDKYTVVVNGVERFSLKKPKNSRIKGGMLNYQIELKSESKISQIKIMVDSGDGKYSLGHISI